MANMGVDTLKANLTNPARIYLWDVLIPEVVGGGADTEALMLRCQSTVIPGKSFTPIQVNYKQTAGIRVHGRLRYPYTWTLTFIEGEDAKMFNAWYGWCQKIVSDRDGVGEADLDTKRDMILSLISTKGNEWLKIKLVGCWVQTIADVTLNYQTDEVIRFTTTISYDMWEKA